ncbi:hypothetical protein TG4357_00252 [Thalassovita gelatinovora]|uniref:Uncharacterized protein n=1 Tax=Thalassovita gelatinovora TaxID=53501 RepID=A0A0P1F4K0_THAGE|nr:hypothetical protein [Thalassovita gelatinovora]QIZ79382.1 hypothetical protein HFZ77_02295 [Thalassovita gelatinovora]CUH62693.1 hypothetical protein TG4357_00252 [Thalassovita gelatinovora]SEQ08636.1 hypothetical protein SAMN04488043_103152 [Thalassovita gelatinovora]
MGRILKWLFTLTVLGFIALVAYAYIGPWLGVDFSAPQQEIHLKVVLDAG